MFKKKPQIKTLSPLRSSDRRKTADRIIAEYHLASTPSNPASDDDDAAKSALTALRASLLPDGALSAKFATTTGPELRPVQGTVYVGSHSGGEQRVLWVALDDRIWPTVYTLWRNAGILPLLHTPGVVVGKLKGGADLMTPGLAGPPFPEGAKKGATVAVASLDAPSVPVAVGVCEVDVSALQSVQGVKGHAVRMLHWEGDELWDWSTSGKGGIPAPDGLEGWDAVLDERLAKDMGEMGLQDEQGEEGGVSLVEENGGQQSEELATKNEGNPYVEGEDAMVDTVTDTDIPEMTTQEIDSTFRKAFIYGIHQQMQNHPSQSKYNLTFPLSQSFVMSDLVLPYLPIFTPKQADYLQIKKTSWKNARKFIKALDKEKLLFSKDRPGNVVDVWDIDFDDPAFRDFVPYRLPKKGQSAAEATGKSTAAGTDTNDDSVGQTLKRVELYKPKDTLAPIFKIAEAGLKSLYTAAELRKVITTYLTSESLISTSNKRLVQLNPLLSNALLSADAPLDAELLAKGTIPRDALLDRILRAHTLPYHAVLRNPTTADDEAALAEEAKRSARSGAPPSVHVQLETRGGNKTVTRVWGMEGVFVGPGALAEELRRSCASSTSVEPLKGGTKGAMEVMVQGPQKDKVVTALERRGVRAQWVDVVDKTKGGKGKR